MHSLFLKKHLIPIAIYLALFTCLLISYPLHGSMPSDLDSWYYVSIFNYYYQYIICHFQGVSVGQPFYPSAYPYLNGEPSLGIFIFWLPFKWSGIGQLWSYNCLVILICVINAFGVYILAGFYYPKSSMGARLLAGLFFCFNNFMIANIDGLNSIFLGFGILALYYYSISIDRQDTRSLIAFTLLMLLQMLICVINFMYIGIVIICISLFHMSDIRKLINKRPAFTTGCLLLGVFAIGAFFYLIISLSDKSHSWNYSTDMEKVKFLSFAPEDFIRVLPGNIYFRPGSAVFWALYFKSFFLGFVLSSLGLWGFALNIKKRPEFGLILLISWIIGLGTYIMAGSHKVLMPVGVVMETFHLYTFYRFPFRVFIIIILIISLLCVLPVEYLMQKLRYKRLVVLLIALVFAIENLPLKRDYYGSERYFAEGEFLKNKFGPQSLSTFLFLPSGDFKYGQSPNVNRTEQIYMYWQTCIRKDVVNGYDSYFPRERVEMDSAIQNFQNDKQGFANYLHKYGIQHIVYYGPKWNLVFCPADIDSVRKIAAEQNIDFTAR